MIRAGSILTILAATMTIVTDAAAQTDPSSPAVAHADADAVHPQAPGTFEWHTYAGAAGARRYKLYLPPSYDAAHPAPLVVMLHGCTQDPDDFARGTRFNELAGEARVIVAWPEQTAAHQPQKCWSWYDPAHQARGGEPDLIAGITREVTAGYAVDPRRVYIAGVSAGAGMAVNVAASYPQLYAAVGAHSGIPYRAASDVPHALAVMRGGSTDPAILAYALQDAAGGRAMPLIAIHGAADAVVSPLNSRQLAAQWAGVLGVHSVFPEHVVEGGRDVETTRWVAADGSTAVELVIVQGLGHAWSGGSPDGTFTDPQGPDASRRILGFLLSHPR